ncbi:ABC transporter substrate-binding protein [Terrarubrum flagellatum]|uniref:ABC transporter substrate-binding protein n=1 Tax=Terrirubrum flagellatum TaxID=2895980 RepID=UPI003144FF80
MWKRFSVALATASIFAAGAALAQTKTVTLWHVFNLETDMIYGGIEAFNASQKEYRIEPRLVPATQIVTELIKATATGSVPDLATLDNPVVASFSGQGTLTDLTDLVAKSQVVRPDIYFQGPWASAQWKGRTFGVPRDANTLALYYNADMFRAKGLDPDKPPKTWSELRAAAEKLRDPAKNVYGFGFCAMQAEEGVFQFLPFLTQAGGSIDKLDQPEATAALEFLSAMVKDGLASKDVINQRQYEVINTFMAGNTAMALGGPWELPRMEKEAKFDWRLTLLPVKDDKKVAASALGGYVFVAPKGAKQVEGAFRFIEFMSNPKILNEGWKSGRLAPRTDVKVDNPLWPQAYGIYLEQMKSAKARGPHPQWPDISKAMQTAMQEAITNAKPAQQAMQEAARKIQPILAKTPL